MKFGPNILSKSYFYPEYLKIAKLENDRADPENITRKDGHIETTDYKNLDVG